ncbi:hypothetical protein GYMLUDRAFT_456912 [Collybiopsis luxurians FD-317 M1]|uniref:Uncharacterized protein n=1 Tax=Collybiopsis luxurians FD-317 M1 TaxID=944289 RepID=A0A0D0CLH6_9AGAR|nr:hypothetical protein GYMLUDRAFT_456912 [Collybiopsis luxurians FD-317 M1]
MPAITAVLIQVTTTTIFPSSSATSTASNSNGSTVPVAAIAGGTSAGALLAVALVIGWTVWGRSIKRAKAKQEREAVSILYIRAVGARKKLKTIHSDQTANNETKYDKKCSDFFKATQSLLQTSLLATFRHKGQVCWPRWVNSFTTQDDTFTTKATCSQKSSCFSHAQDNDIYACSQ